MDLVRARDQDPETCRALFILAAEILGVASISVGHRLIEAKLKGEISQADF